MLDKITIFAILIKRGVGSIIELFNYSNDNEYPKDDISHKAVPYLFTGTSIARGKILGAEVRETILMMRKFRISGQCCAIGATAGP